jgi:hypothetical protein
MKRYTLELVFGLSAFDDDTDGHIKMDTNAFTDFVNAMKSASTVEELKDRYAEAYRSAVKAKDGNATLQIIAANQARYTELTKAKVKK